MTGLAKSLDAEDVERAVYLVDNGSHRLPDEPGHTRPSRVGSDAGALHTEVVVTGRFERKIVAQSRESYRVSPARR
jgi:hypothetical protein